MKTWSEAVLEAIYRKASNSPDGMFTRTNLLEHELDQIVSEVGSIGKTPHQTLSHELQEMRDAGLMVFVDDEGTYRLVR